MGEMFRLLKELTTSQTLEKVLVRDEARHRVTKHINAISLVKILEEKCTQDDAISNNDIVRLDGSDTVVSLKEVDKENEAGNGTGDEVVKSAEEKLKKIDEKNPERQPTLSKMKQKTYNLFSKGTLHDAILKKKRLNDERPAKTDIRLSLASHLYIYPLGIAEEVLVNVAGYVYPVDFMILDIKEDEKRPFILGTPFLTTTKAVIKFDKGTITLRPGKSKMSFHRLPESLCRIEKTINKAYSPHYDHK
uniref:Reverse transcriptase domain-containing protein n=1 Tax=Tanacetum cinerariifolium TaxID=118510 RepID=A0A699HFL7_TANCI|nr:reverse transcriptase domain-containing protein [Tanacetum cinerariifolium]